MNFMGLDHQGLISPKLQTLGKWKAEVGEGCLWNWSQKEFGSPDALRKLFSHGLH